MNMNMNFPRQYNNINMVTMRMMQIKITITITLILALILPFSLALAPLPLPLSLSLSHTSNTRSTRSTHHGTKLKAQQQETVTTVPDETFSKTIQEKHVGIRPTLSTQSHAHKTAIVGTPIPVDIHISSPTRGLGAFASSPIKLGTLLGHYDGEILSVEEVKARIWNTKDKSAEDEEWLESRSGRSQSVSGSYLLELPCGGKCVDAEDGDKASWCRFMNHATEGTGECNVKVFHQATIGGDLSDYPFMFAIQDIEVGDELCWDYGGKYFI